jgi:predicted nuclease of restriction endonuclease-like (RecB) superfamily
MAYAKVFLGLPNSRRSASRIELDTLPDALASGKRSSPAVVHERSSQSELVNRALERQLGTLYYERLLASSDRSAVEQEALANLNPLQRTPREFVHDPVMLEFLGLPGSGKLLESELEQALLDHLQEFLLELGKGFAFVARQQRISTESKDFYIDLVFYNFLLKCFVLFELKSTELTHQDIGYGKPDVIKSAP